MAKVPRNTKRSHGTDKLSVAEKRREDRKKSSDQSKKLSALDTGGRHGMSCAIVGPAAYMVGSGLGPEIDSHDVVVRLNSGHEYTALHGKDIGRKTDYIFINRWMSRNLNLFNIPPNVLPIKKVHVRPDTMIKGEYEANTGILCIAFFAHKGYKVTVYGMDFYSGPYEGIIPSQSVGAATPKDRVQSVERKSVYFPGYNENLYGSETHVLGHVGGMRDFAVFMKMKEDYGISQDAFLSAIIENNKHRLK